MCRPTVYSDRAVVTDVFSAWPNRRMSLFICPYVRSTSQQFTGSFAHPPHASNQIPSVVPPRRKKFSIKTCKKSSAIFCRPSDAACRKSLAGIVICGSGPNLSVEPQPHRNFLVFLNPDLFDLSPIRTVAFSLPLSSIHWLDCDHVTAAWPETR